MLPFSPTNLGYEGLTLRSRPPEKTRTKTPIQERSSQIADALRWRSGSAIEHAMADSPRGQIKDVDERRLCRQARRI